MRQVRKSGPRLAALGVVVLLVALAGIAVSVIARPSHPPRYTVTDASLLKFSTSEVGVGFKVQNVGDTAGSPKCVAELSAGSQFFDVLVSSPGTVKPTAVGSVLPISDRVTLVHASSGTPTLQFVSCT
jgi:hypothetical protein